MRKIQSFFSFIGNKILLVALSFVIILHVCLMFYYLQNNRLLRQKARHDAVSQKIMNTIFMLQAMPDPSRPNAVAAMDDPDLKTSLTKKPKWKLRFYDVSFWKINRVLRKHLNNFTISIQLNQLQWLNLNATVYSHVFSEQLLFIMIEVFKSGSSIAATAFGRDGSGIACNINIVFIIF